MDRYSRENVLRIEDNDPNFTSLMIGGGVDADIDANFVSSRDGHFNRLGTYIGTNTHIKELEIDFDSCRAMNATDTAFFGGLTRNTSINKLVLRFGRFGVGQVGQEILRAYQENNSHLHISILNSVEYMRILPIWTIKPLPQL